jgi:hypothetical protein
MGFLWLGYQLGFVDKSCTLINPNNINYGLGFVVLFDRIFGNIGKLCLYIGTIINNNNSIISNGKGTKFLSATLNMSLNKLSTMLYD